MITITTDFEPLKGLAETFANVNKEIESALWEHVEETSLGLEARVKDGMPRDTGRAKAGWGHYTPQDLAPGKRRIGKGKRITKRTRFITGKGLGSGRTQISSSSDAIWEEDRSNLSITQGTNVFYTSFVNDGTVRYAGTGHIDRAFAWAEKQMANMEARLSNAFEKAVSRRYTR